MGEKKMMQIGEFCRRIWARIIVRVRAGVWSAMEGAEKWNDFLDLAGLPMEEPAELEARILREAGK